MEKTPHSYVVMLNDRVFVADSETDTYTMNETEAEQFPTCSTADEVSSNLGGKVGRVTLNIEIMEDVDVTATMAEESGIQVPSDAAAPAPQQ